MLYTVFVWYITCYISRYIPYGICHILYISGSMVYTSIKWYIPWRNLPDAKCGEELVEDHDGKPIPVHKPPILCHIPWIWHGYYNIRYIFSKMSYPCHIHVISFFQKRYIWIYLVYPKLKNCIWYIPGISFHVICHAYPCPIHVISLSGCLAPAANEIQLEIALRSEFCIPQQWQHNVHRAQ